MENVTFCRTNAGNGFKIVVNNTWLFVSKDILMEVVTGERKSCQFKAFKKEEEE